MMYQYREFTLHRFLFLLILSMFLQGFLPLSVASTEASDILNVSTEPLVPVVGSDNRFSFSLVVSLDKQWHVNSHKPKQDFLIATTVEFVESEKFSVSKVVYPPAHDMSFDFSEEKVAVYSGTFRIAVQGTMHTSAGKGDVLEGSIHYQACNNKTCRSPDSVPFRVTFKVQKPGALPVEHESTASSEKPPRITDYQDSKERDVSSTGSQKSDEQVRPSQAVDDLHLTESERQAKEYLDRGIFLSIFLFFLSGLLLNLTPCVYPVIPITVSYFGSQGEQQRGSRFGIAATYALGIAVVFAVLGLLSSLAGKQWGFLFQNQWFIVLLALIVFALAASMFGAFEIRVPSSLMTRFGQSREGYAGSLIMGLTVGVVIAPCAAGLIIGLVGLVAKMGLVIRGTVLFFAMGLGLALPYLILAAFSGLLSNMPRSGMWMVWVRKFFGILLIGVGFHFIIPQASRLQNQEQFYFGLIALFGGLYLGFLDHNQGYTKAFNMARRLFGLVLAGAGIYLLSLSFAAGLIHTDRPASPINWIPYQGQALEQLIEKGRPTIIDFYADWCIPCKKMDQSTFEHHAVVQRAPQVTMVKVDCTKPDAKVRALMNRFSVTGLPSVVFIDAGGKVREKLRVVEFIDGEQFAQRMQSLINMK